MRHNFGSTGLYPTNGALSQSPDIIPIGTQPISNPDQFISDDNWNKDFGSSTNASVPNYIYIRGANLAGGESTGKFYLYYSPASLLLWPQDPLGNPGKGWADRPLKTSTGSQYVTVKAAAGARLVTPEPFRWIPEPIPNDHYCLIGRVVTDQNPNPIPKVGTLTDFARYISEHPNMAWRNVTTINPGSAVSTRIQNYSQGDVGGEVYLFLKCVNAPIGSAVEASGQQGDIVVNIPKTIISSDTSFAAGISITLPAGFSTDIAFTWYSEGKVPIPGMQITLDVLFPQLPDDELYDRATPLEEFGLPDDFIAKHNTSGVGPVRAIRLGSCGMETPNAPTVKAGGDGLVGEAAGGAGKATEAAAGLSFHRVGWKEAQVSVLGQSFVSRDVSVKKSSSSGVEVETASITGRPAGAETPDLEAELFFDSGANIPAKGGQVYFMLTAQNIPRGCKVAFSSGDTEPPINLPWAEVNNPTKFVTGTFADLPEGFEAPITLKFSLAGKTLSPTESVRSLSLAALLQLPGGGVDAQDEAASPAKLLGQATVNL